MIIGSVPIVLASSIFANALKEFNKWFSGPVEGILKSAFDGDIVGSLATLLSASNKLYSSGFNYAQTMINNVVEPVGTALIITFFLINIMTIVSREALTLETLIKQLVLLVIVFTLTSNSQDIASAVLKLGDRFINGAVTNANTFGLSGSNGVYTYSKTSSQSKNIKKRDEVIADAAEGLSESYGLAALLIAGILWIFIKLSVVAIFTAVLARGIELIWRTIFMPIGLANSFEGANSPGIRYLKSYIATALSGGMMIIIIIIGWDLSLGILGYATSANGIMRIIMAGSGLSATAGAANAAGNKVKEIFS